MINLVGRNRRCLKESPALLLAKTYKSVTFNVPSPRLSNCGLELLQHTGAHSCTIDHHHDASSADYETFDNCLHLLDCSGRCDELGSQWLWYSTYLRCKKMGLLFQFHMES
jgi:hypothetical protein